ncbi:MAG: hypothetical protein MMC23_005121 [Stictis urceolatum]|nr:hypothetical protein [Stictis urceolata]
MAFRSLLVAFLIAIVTVVSCSAHVNGTARTECRVQQGLNSDDAIEIKRAFAECGQGGRIIFANTTYNVASVMNTTGLKDVDIELHGTLLWSKDIDYWLNHSLPIGYQNQSSAWFLGGENIHWNGFDYGTLDGNGQVWYDFVNGESNYPNRPHAITLFLKDSVVEGLRFVQSQMWTMTVKDSENVLLQDIYVNSTSSSGAPARNTDGADTLYANNITFSRWNIDNGDDAIALKANSSNIFIHDSVFRRGQGLAIGSIGQYPDHYEFQRVANEVRWAGYIKTWTGVQKGYPPNGGGGGTGYIRNITWSNFTHVSSRGSLSITQCTSFSGQTGDCDTSTFKISDLHWTNMSGTTQATDIAELQCSGAAPCEGVEIHDVVLETADGNGVTGFACSNVEGEIGFEC